MNCQNCKTDFIIEPDDFAFYEKMGVPAPTFCPECRFQRRMMFRNDRTFYRRKCDLCKESIISTYSEEVKHPVYCVKCWWSDDWDPCDHGVDFDFSRPFFEQFNELREKVPALAILNDNGVASVNCEYTYDWFYSKNCYMNVAGWHAENVFYSYHIEHNKDIMDSTHMRNSEMVYESIQSYKIVKSNFCVYCSDCVDCFLGFDLRGCTDCAMCIGLRNQRYCIKNIQYTKEEYQEKIKELNLSSYKSIQKLKKEFQEFKLNFPHKYSYILKSVDSTGDFIINSKNSKHCFMTINGENLKFIFGCDSGKDTYDCDMTGKSELCYNCVVADEASLNICTVFCNKSNEVNYSTYCPGANWCFGSVSLKKGMYSILNKKYTKEEYLKLKEKVITHMKNTGEWGLFFPIESSSYAYNESAAQEFFPLTENQAKNTNYRWKESQERNYQIDIEPENIPDDIKDVDNTILEKIIKCEHDGDCNHKCTTAFKIVPDELVLYKKLNIPIPHLCPNCRHYERIKQRNPIKLWHRQCMCEKGNHQHEGKCEIEFETSYAPDRPEIVYCEKCYQQEVV